MKGILVALCLVALPVSAAHAEMETSFYLGHQSANASNVRGTDPGGIGAFDFDAVWKGESFEPPPYYGFRLTWWQTERLGLGLDFNHAKVAANGATLAASGFSDLEFTNGLNVLTVNGWYRWPNADRRWTPYVGAGIGVSIPHVEVMSAGGRTYEYQYGGPAVQAVAGLSYDISPRWAVFGEYKGTWTRNDLSLNNGGNLRTDIVTHALNIGLSYRF